MKRRNALLLSSLVVFSLVITSAHGSGTMRTKTERTKVVYDQHVGITEQELLSDKGPPKTTDTFALSDVGDEMRMHLHTALKDSPGITIKEIYYANDAGEQIYWLVETGGVWRVISDVRIPAGVMF